MDMPYLPARVELVLLDRRPTGVEASMVSCNTRSAARDLCHHLFALDRTRVAMVGGIPEMQTWLDRLEGYLDAHRETGRIIDDSLVTTGNYRSEAGVDAVRRLMALPDPPEAIIAASTQVLDGVLEELAVLGLRIPEDIAVSCVDDPRFPAFFRPRLTFVEQPGYEMGVEAVRILMNGIQAGGGQPTNKVFAAHLQVGESCGERLPKAQGALLAQ